MQNDPIAVVTRYIEECVNGRNFDAVDELLSDDFVDKTAPPGIPPGKEGRKLWLQKVTAAFPDLHSTIEDIFTDGEKVATRVTARMTHERDFMGIAPTGKLIESTAVAFDRVVDGKIVEKWEMRDLQSVIHSLADQ